ncbi:PspC domain-containing protein [Planosporangium thailandense]|uniref:PspC domain-containing protein n=1 Tax=Planosporangium thailandense TaxID=765197 RepID=A0ABX0XVX9_9ACTN|nr:PspC domain-containing protein [Planosporangium thailandense]NJC70199.1 PspC domain-containing protein [Planosporangium thailandense]
MTETSYRKLYRSRTNRMVAGVCGGIAEYSNMDPTIVRVLFVVLAFFTGGGALLAYPILWMIVPEAPLQPAAAWTPPTPGAPR